MLSFAFRTNLKNFSVIISKTEAVNSIPFITLQRTVCTSSVLKSGRAGRNLPLDELNMHQHLNTGRKPKDFGKIAVLDENEVEPDYEYLPDEYVRKPSKKKKPNSKNKPGNEKSIDDELRYATENDAEDNTTEINYKNLKNEPSLLSSILSNLKVRKQREKLNKIIIEGKKLIHEAIAAGCQPEIIFFSRVSDVKNLNIPEGTDLYRVLYKDLKIWSDVESCQGLIGVFKTPELNQGKYNYESIPLTVICDNVREPGNLGVILRVAVSVGCEKIILTPGCVDLWSPKVLRSAAGAHFRLPILKSLPWSDVRNEILEGSKIILAESYRKSANKENHDSTEDEPATSDGLPSFCYSSQNYSNGNIVLVIGGEAHGISKEAIQLATEQKGFKVYIPMSNDTESLNCGTAMAVVSYEIRRQMESSTKNGSQVKESETGLNDYQELTSVQSN